MSSISPLPLPEWILAYRARAARSSDEAMKLAIEIAAENVKRGGGPFGAVVVRGSDSAVVGVGANLVVLSGLSVAHAEVVALSDAQRSLGTFMLANNEKESFSLVTSAAPCIMCFGAILWSGIGRVIIGARREEVENATHFDEGPLIPRWRDELHSRYIEIEEDVMRVEASAVLKSFQVVPNSNDYQPQRPRSR